MSSWERGRVSSEACDWRQLRELLDAVEETRLQNITCDRERTFGLNVKNDGSVDGDQLAMHERENVVGGNSEATRDMMIYQDDPPRDVVDINSTPLPEDDGPIPLRA
ncbi:hypothetical protein NDU88_007345 [Pleurodeles waltl]|uniref:Uncharacterized protein n=1 Tax=Pleurodeles waltl TaxID=8319 RepID=A0AAV7U039_PLEWA|nr:hypothetical protein NDU88_007345 [Pleurodeles waltl]